MNSKQMTLDLIDLLTIFTHCADIELLLISHVESGVDTNVLLIQSGLFVSLDYCAIMPVFSSLTFLFSPSFLLSACLVLQPVLCEASLRIILQLLYPQRGCWNL